MTVSGDIVSHDSSDYAWRAVQNMSNGYDGYDNDTYARVDLVRGAGAESYFYFIFDDLSALIPADSKITAVSCTTKVRATYSVGNRFSYLQAQLFNGTVAKGSPTTFSNSTNPITLSDCGTWTVSELSNARIRIYVQRATANVTSSLYVYFYGATLTVDYKDASGTPYTIKVKSNGDWVDVSKVLVKQNGVWHEAQNVLVKDNGIWK